MPKLCQSVTIARKGTRTITEITWSAKNSDGSRKEPMRHSSSHGLEIGMAIYGKTFYYLGFSCGKMQGKSSTPLILAFLTTQ
ncbi:MAG: hypothetical protein WEE53_04770, partial [Acidimicrobiia bacterium]